jgi:hypothetical protein
MLLVWLSSRIDDFPLLKGRSAIVFGNDRHRLGPGIASQLSGRQHTDSSFADAARRRQSRKKKDFTIYLI